MRSTHNQYLTSRDCVEKKGKKKKKREKKVLVLSDKKGEVQ